MLVGLITYLLPMKTKWR